MPRRTRRIHALAHLITQQLEQKGARTEWLEDAVAADLGSNRHGNGPREIRVSIADFFASAQEDQELDISVDEEAGEVVIRLAGNPSAAARRVEQHPGTGAVPA